MSRNNPTEHDLSPHTVLRHPDGAYSLAIGYPPDQEWDLPVLGHYASRAEADAAMVADRLAQAEKPVEK